MYQVNIYMSSTKFILLLMALVGTMINVSAQSKEKFYPKPAHEEWFKAIPMIDSTTPEWAQVMYTESDNFEKIERLKIDFYRKHKWEKNIHIQNYKHWLKIVKDNVGDDGKVSLEDPAELFQKYEKEKKTIRLTEKRMDPTWTNIGPSNTLNADGSQRPTQANVFCLGVAPSDPSTVYAGMETGGIFKTTDKGLTWNPTSWDYAIGSPEEIKVDPANADIVYVADGANLYKSTDGGTVWNLHWASTHTIEQLYINTSNTQLIYAATRGGVYKTENAGQTWSSIFTGYIYDIEAKPGSNDVLYISVLNDAAKRPEIFKTTNSGTSWQLKDTGFYVPSDLTASTVYGCKIGVTPADPDRVYAGIIATGKEGDNGWIGIYHSTNGADNWINESGADGASIDDGDGTWSYPSGSDMSTNWYVGGYSSGYHQGWYNFDIDVSHTDPDKLWIGTIWFSESGNKGANIEYVRGTRGLSMHADIQDIDVVGGDIWIASDGGLNYSNDECLTMETRMSGMTASDFWGFGQGWNEDVWVGGRYHNGNAAFHENYGAGNTLFLGGAETGTGYVNQQNNNKTYFSDIGDKLIPDNLSDGASDIANLGLYPTEAYYHFSYSEVEWHPYKANVVFVGKEDKLYKSTDGGITFNTTHTFTGNIRRYEISRTDPNYIYAIVNISYWNWEIHKSTDGGESFVPISKPTLTSGSWRNLSFTLNPFDENEIWLASNSSSDGNKIFSSIDGGDSWTNRYGSELAGQAIKDMIYQGATTGDQVYVMTNDNFFTFDKNADSWQSYKDGLPVQHSGFMILPFYRDDKIRMASAKGIWEASFDASSKVQAIPMIDKDKVLCQRDTSQLESYAIVNQDGASWLWSISPAPDFISDVTARNPQVVFGPTGNYDVTLTVTNADGLSDTRTITNFATVLSNCNADDVAGKSLSTDVNGESVVIRDVNLTNVTHFSVTGWWKPAGAQQAYSALVSSGDWCAHCDYTEGLIYDYYGNRLWYKWPGNADNWASNSGMEIPENEWSYVALVITPDSAIMYLNDEKYTHVKDLQPGNIQDLYVAYGHYSKSFKGEIDEVCIWNKALTDDEVYELKHITKHDAIDNDPNLIAYYQFNETAEGSYIVDKKGSRHGVIGLDTELKKSSVPVGKGTAELISLNPSINEYNFTTAGAKIYMSDCEEPSGKIVVSKLEVSADTLGVTELAMEEYWIVNSISNNGSFPYVDSIVLITTDTSFIDSTTTTTVLHTRGEHQEGDTWTAQAEYAKLDGYTYTFYRDSRVKGDQQIILSDGAPSYVGVDPGKPCEVDTVPGNVLVLPGNSGDYAEIPALNINSNTITMSAWIKPNGPQNDWAGILFARGGTTTAGLSMKSDNELRYHWNNNEYGWSSGAYAALDKWNHVVLVVAPSSATIYLNGEPYTRSVTHSPETFDAPMRVGNDATSGARTFDGQIDEVCIWNKVLTQAEIRSLRHLTKEDLIETDTDFLVYLQFNEEKGKAYDKTAYDNNTLLNGSASRAISTVPVGGGVSESFDVTGAASISSVTGINLTFDVTGTYPDGNIVLSRINLSPDQKPGVKPVSKSYWVINNYGANQSFTALSNMTFSDVGLVTSYSVPKNYQLSRREENDFGMTWLGAINAQTVDAANQSIVFGQGLNVTSFGQFIIDHHAAKGWIGVESTDWHTANNWGEGVVPSGNDEVVIPALTPYQPVISQPAAIKSIYLQAGAQVISQNGEFNILGL